VKLFESDYRHPVTAFSIEIFDTITFELERMKVLQQKPRKPDLTAENGQIQTFGNMLQHVYTEVDEIVLETADWNRRIPWRQRKVCWLAGEDSDVGNNDQVVPGYGDIMLQ
jgi:hypothetical protein